MKRAKVEKWRRDFASGFDGRKRISLSNYVLILSVCEIDVVEDCMI